jgi:cyclic pyranopterin phosphate synthase
MKDEYLSYEEITRLIKVMAKYNLKKVRITGGEPLIRPELDRFVKMIRDVEGIDDISLTTNALTLAKHIKKLKDAGLDRLNISLDTLKREKFKFMTGGNLEDVLEGIREAKKVGFDNIKINIVALKNSDNPFLSNVDEVLDFVEFAKEYKLEIRFIEMMPIGFNFNMRQNDILYTSEIKAIIENKYGELIPSFSKGSGAARVYLLPKYNIKVGFISPISQPFCDNCSKLRLTADGNIKLCLRTDEEIMARDIIRNGSDEELDRFVREVIKEKKISNERIIMSNYQFSECSRNMIGIGG